jgi:hypothetical protein
MCNFCVSASGFLLLACPWMFGNCPSFHPVQGTVHRLILRMNLSITRCLACSDGGLRAVPVHIVLAAKCFLLGAESVQYLLR